MDPIDINTGTVLYTFPVMSLELSGFVGQTPLPETVGEVWTIEDIQRSGLAVNQRIRNSNSLEYYVRESSLNVWKFLSESLNKPVEVPLRSITGDTGCGKSTLLYGWVRHRSTSVKVLWSSVNQLNNQIYIRIFEPTGVLYEKEIKYDTLEQGQIALKNEILAILTFRTDVKHVVIDGITSYRFVCPIGLQLCKRTQSMVVCTSMPAAWTDLPASVADYCTLYLFTMEGWTLHELLEAQRVSKELNRLIFDTNITNSAEAFYERFRVAGCNMRFMASTDGNTETIKILYKYALQRMSGQQLLNWPHSNNTDNDNCDILYQHRYVNSELVTSFVSSYVEDRAVSRIESTSLFLAALLDPYNNNIMHGWLYASRVRLAVKSLVRGGGGAIRLHKHRCGMFSAYRHYNKTLTMRVQRYIDYDALPTPLDFSTLENGWSAVYLPTQYYQAGFDMVYVALENSVCKVYFLQFTMALTHDAKLQYAESFLAALLPNIFSKSTMTRTTSAEQYSNDEISSNVPKISSAPTIEKWSTSVNFYFVLPKENIGVFKVGTTMETVESLPNNSKIRTVFVESVTDHKNATHSVS